jgi:hypothetical protein
MNSDETRDRFDEALDAALAALPREIRPERDLREDIWSRIHEPRARTLWSARYTLAAAAVLLVALSSLITLAVINRERRMDFAAGHRDDVTLVASDAGTLERQYSEEVEELEMVLRKSRGALSPETVRILQENLTIIDSAIREAQSALAADPNSDMLVDLLRSAYQRKLELLRQAAESSPVT